MTKFKLMQSGIAHSKESYLRGEKELNLIEKASSKMEKQSFKQKL